MVRALLLITPILLGNFINDVSESKFKKAILTLLIMAGIAILYRLFECLNSFVYHRLFNRQYQSMYEKYISITNDNSMFSLSRFTMGEYSNIVINDINVVSTFYTTLVIRVVQFMEFFFIYSYFLKLNIFLFVIVIICSVVIFLLSFKATVKLQGLNTKTKLNLDKLVSSTNEFFMGIKEIKSLNIFDKIRQGLSNKMGSYLEANRNYSTRSTYTNQIFLLAWEIVRIISVLYALLLLKKGIIAIGVILIIYNYYQKIIDNFSMILTINLDYRILNISLGRLNKINEYSVKKSKSKTPKIENFNGRIVFDNILYGYKNNPTLNNVSFTIEPNSITVLESIQNRKTSGVFDLLLKLNSQHEGNVFFDDININNIDDKEYFNYVSISRAEPFFFNLSVKENLMLINEDYETIVTICKKIGLDSYLKNIGTDSDAEINNNPYFNSIAKQLLSIARMLIRNSKLMFFDEGIDLLDLDTKKKVIKVIQELSKNHTIVIATHDEKIKAIADKIVNLD